jgi:hypothetical protein
MPVFHGGSTVDEQSELAVVRRTVMAEVDEVHGLPDAMPRSLVDVPTAVRFALGVGGG